MSKADDFLDGKISADDFLDEGKSVPVLPSSRFASEADLYGTSEPWNPKDVATTAIKQLPVVGSTLGAVGGAAGGTAVGGPVGGYAGGVGGAAVGGGLGDLASNLLLQKLGLAPPQPMEANLDSAMTEGGMQGVFQAVPFGKILAPFAKKLSPEAAAVAKETAERGIPVSPSSIQPGIVSKTAQATADWGPGRLWTHFKRMQIDPKMLQYRKEVIESLPGGGPGVTDFKIISNNLKEETKATYTTMKEMVGKDGKIGLTKTYEKIDTALDRVSDPAIKARLEKFIQNGREQTAAQFDDFQKKYWSGLYTKGGNAKSSDAKIMGEIMEAMKADMEAFGTATGKDILGTYLKAKELSMTERAMGAVRIMFEKSIRRPDGLAEHFSPGTFVQIFQKNQKQLEKALPKDTYETIRQFADVAQAVTGDYAKTKGMDQAVSAILGAGAAGGAVYAPLWVAVPSGFSLVMAKSLMNPKGWVRDWLTTGILQGAESGAAKAGLRLGGRALITNSRGGIADAGDVMIGDVQ